MSAALVAENLSKSFVTGAVRTDVLRGLSVQVQAGELTLVSGPSGCGKSTLLAILSALLRPDGGRAYALGQDLGRLSARERERFRLHHTGFVFQGFNLFPALDAIEQVALPLGYLGLDDATARRRATAALEEVGLASRMRLRPAELSGGEKQRVAIARTILKNPAIFLFDEATSALDTHTEREIQANLREVSQGRSTLIIAHRLSTVADADEIIVLADGRIVERGRHPQLLARGGVYAGMWARQQDGAQAGAPD